MIKHIAIEQTFPLRSAVLRNGAPIDQCTFPTDEMDKGFHLGYFVADQLVSIATFYPVDYEDRGLGGYRLRGMATAPLFSGKGYGSELIKFAINELRSANASYIWCHARSSATEFYKKLGFEIISDEFDLPGIGPHFNMIKTIA